MRVRFGETWIPDSEQTLLLFEPGRYPVAYFPETDISSHALERTDQTIEHPISGARPGIRSGRAYRSHHEGHGSTLGCLPTRASCRDGSRLPGRRRMHFTKKKNGLQAT